MFLLRFFEKYGRIKLQYNAILICEVLCMIMTPDVFADGYMDRVNVGTGFAAVGAVLVLVLVIALLCLGLALLCYIFQSLGLYRIAKRRGIRNGWLAWLPVGNMWILGSIADQYQYVAKGQVKNRRKILLGLSIACMVLSGLGNVISFVLSMTAGMTGDTNSAAGFMISVLVSVIIWVIAIVAMVFQYIAYYDLYCSCDPDDSVLFLVLSILFSVAIPFFVFALRNKDRGMPPRKDAVTQETCPVEEYLELTDEPVAQPEEFEDL